MNGCLACELTSGERELPGGQIRKTPCWVVEHCVGPLGLGTLIVKPIRHITHVWDLNDTEAEELGPLIQRVAQALATLAEARTALCDALVARWRYTCAHPLGVAADRCGSPQRSVRPSSSSRHVRPRGHTPSQRDRDHRIATAHPPERKPNLICRESRTFRESLDMDARQRERGGRPSRHLPGSRRQPGADRAAHAMRGAPGLRVVRGPTTSQQLVA